MSCRPHARLPPDVFCCYTGGSAPGEGTKAEFSRGCGTRAQQYKVAVHNVIQVAFFSSSGDPLRAAVAGALDADQPHAPADDHRPASCAGVKSGVARKNRLKRHRQPRQVSSGAGGRGPFCRLGIRPSLRPEPGLCSCFNQPATCGTSCLDSVDAQKGAPADIEGFEALKALSHAKHGGVCEVSEAVKAK